MPFYSQSTPESLLPRSDSKNPATTCKGLTSNGRPCRRSLVQSPRASPRRGEGVLAVVSHVDGRAEGAAAFYCWQHKDQAPAADGAGGTTIVDIPPSRTSTDSLAARLGVLSIIAEDDSQGRHAKRSRLNGSEARPVRRDTLPQAWQGVSSPLISVPADQQLPLATPLVDQRRQAHRRPGDLHISLFCCVRSSDVDKERAEPARPVAPAVSQPPASKGRLPKASRSSPARPSATAAAGKSQPTKGLVRPQSTTPTESSRAKATTQFSASRANEMTPAPFPPMSAKDPASAYTQALRSFIPTGTPEATAKLLLAELAKPLSPSDHEPGYVYIFWLTPQSGPSPGDAEASTLLAPPSTRPAIDGRRTSDILRAYSVKQPTRNERTLMLKIGRASNVHRRMNEWSRQCGHHITLLRFYPYHSGRTPSPGLNASPAASPAASPHPSPIRSQPSASPRRNSDISDSGGSGMLPRKVPFVARVERLIHVELAAQRVMRDCDGCGKQHREWFEVAATKEGVKAIDRVVRRWAEWALVEGDGR